MLYYGVVHEWLKVIVRVGRTLVLYTVYLQSQHFSFTSLGGEIFSGLFSALFYKHNQISQVFALAK